MGADHRLLYSRQNIHNLVVEYIKLLDKSEKEHIYQVFFQDNPLLLSTFHPVKIFNKGTVLGLFETDFCILNAQNELLLVEIEKPSTKLFTKNGHRAAGLTHAYGQVTDWLGHFVNHRQACLEALKLSDTTVSAVKGVVIAGRTNNESEKFLNKHRLVQTDSNIAFYTFDDMYYNLLNTLKDL